MRWPLSRLEFEIAWRYLRSRRGSRLLSFITVIAIGGIVVGVSALIVIIGVMNGLQTDLREKILVGSPDIRVLAYGEELRMPAWRGLLDTVRAKPGVVAAAPFVLTQALMRKEPGNYMEGVSVAGIFPTGTGGPAVTTIRDHAIEGDFKFESSDGTHHGAVIGKLLASRFSASIGSKLVMITSTSGQVNPVTGMPVPRIMNFEVTGIFETGMYEYDNQYVYVNMPDAQDLAGLDTAVSGLEVRAVSRAAAPDVADGMHLDFPYHTVDWHEQNSSLFKALSLEKLSMSVILSLIVFVAAFNIVGTLTMVVRDKTREIGILKAMGLPSSSVKRIFLAQGLVIGIVGTGIGLSIGLVVGLAIGQWHLIALDPQVYFIDHLPVQMQPFDVVLIVVLGLLVATLATLYPAIQASRLYPIEAIRSE
ncbi:MAG: FtsX-like permease family protein [Gemmatimonadaceae bacterium]